MSVSEELVRSFAQEWGELTEQARAAAQRKREMRETLEQFFSSTMPRLNQELEEAGSGYRFEEMQYAGYTAWGPLSFRLHPRSTAEWQEQDEHDGWVDMERANELAEFVNNSQTMQKVREVFPHISVAVEYNLISFDPPEDDTPVE